MKCTGNCRSTPVIRFAHQSLSGKLRDELLDREGFNTLKEAQVLIEHWRQHSSTGANTQGEDRQVVALRPREAGGHGSYRRACEVTFAIQGYAVRERRRSGVSAFHASQQASTMAS